MDTVPQEAANQILQDERWQLVQRIVASAGFRRAEQLRAMLQYVAQAAILRPEEPPREHEIAQAVMRRRANFDPAYDNIVRVQAVHLRKKLEEYFNTEGAKERILLTIPKGTYLPHFQPASAVSSRQPVAALPPQMARFLEVPQGRLPTWARKRIPVWALAFPLVIFAALAPLFLHRQTAAPGLNQNLIWHPFGLHGGSVSVVLTDNSLMEIQNLLNTTVTLQDYLSSDFPDNQLSRLRDPDSRRILSFLSKVRNTDATDASTASMILANLDHAGLHGNLRYARDLRVQDLQEGNFILIGSTRSDLWISLFTDRMNYRFVRNESQAYFVNVQPHPGEPEKYVCGSEIDYVVVALMTNLTNSGEVLLIDGSSPEANRSAVEFLLHGNLPSPIANALLQKDGASFELLLRGEHLPHQANDAIKVASYRLHIKE